LQQPAASFRDIMDIDPVTHPTWHSAQVLRVRDGRLMPAPQADQLAEETPIALEFNGISHATMLATPADLDDFALGFSLTEGIVASAHDIRGIELREECDGVVVEVEISSACAARLKERRRAMSGRTGCGLCGVETLPEVVRDVAPVARAPALPLATALAAMQALRERQPLHAATGATHAAAWADADGQLRYVREDVGRHNALDKLVGALARADIDAAQRAGSLIVVSSRASFEMVQKTAAAGVGMLAAVSAPTALAQRLSQRLGVGLMGFMRGNDATIYACPERISG